MKNKLLKAALLHFQAEKSKAEVNLDIYLKNSVGVGEHPDLVTEIVNLTKTIAEANECIAILLNNLKEKK